MINFLSKGKKKKTISEEKSKQQTKKLKTIDKKVNEIETYIKSSTVWKTRLKKREKPFFKPIITQKEKLKKEKEIVKTVGIIGIID